MKLFHKKGLLLIEHKYVISMLGEEVKENEEEKGVIKDV
jgi:hypothetical protein